MLDITATLKNEIGMLQRADNKLTSLSKTTLATLLLVCQVLLLYGDFATGPWLPFSAFYLLSMFAAVKYLGVRTAYIITFLLVCGKTYIKTTWIPDDVHWSQIAWQFISSYTIYTFFCYLINSQLIARRQAENIAIRASQRAGAAERKLLNIGEETQQRIGRELHDDLGQHLTGVAFMTQVLSQKLAGREESADAEKITLMLNQAISKTRNIAHGLYPAEMEEQGLQGMLEKFACHAREMYHVKCHFSCDRDCEFNDHEVAIHLFRITQEAVSNAVKHGHASSIVLRMTRLPNSQTLEILDNGCGIDTPTISTGLGLRSMRYRAEMINATLDISSRAEGGSRIAVSLPTQALEPEHEI